MSGAIFALLGVIVGALVVLGATHRSAIGNVAHAVKEVAGPRAGVYGLTQREMASAQAEAEGALDDEDE